MCFCNSWAVQSRFVWLSESLSQVRTSKQWSYYRALVGLVANNRKSFLFTHLPVSFNVLLSLNKSRINNIEKKNKARGRDRLLETPFGRTPFARYPFSGTTVCSNSHFLENPFARFAICLKSHFLYWHLLVKSKKKIYGFGSKV